MLEGLRAAQNTWVGKGILTVVMGLIVVSFVIWGIGDIFRGISVNEVAKVGSIGISVASFQQSYQTELQTLQQRARRAITNEEAHQFGLDGQVLSRMISDAVMDDRVAALGLAISDAQLAKSITSDPAYAGPGGAFDKTRFNASLRDQGYNEQSFVKEQRRVYLRQQFVQALLGEMAVPKAALEVLDRFQSEARAIDDLTLTAAALGPIPPPDDAAVQSYFDAHKRAFDAPQYRKLVLLSLTPASLAKPDEVSDADARKLYDAVKNQRYGTPERRTVQQILFPSEAEAAAALARLKSGTPFADIAKDRKLEPKDVDLGTVTKEQIFDKAVADAAFSLPADGTSEPVKGTFGPVLAHVVAIQPSALKPYEDVAPALKQELALKTSTSRIQGLHDKIEDARSSGKSLTDAAKAAGLETKTIDSVDDKGLDKDGKPVEGLNDREALLRAAFASDVGVDNDTVQGRDGGMTWFEVAAVDPARPKPLAEVKAQVVAAWTEQEITRKLDAKAADLVKSIDGGQTMAAAALSLGNLPVAQAVDIKRGGAKGFSNEVVAQVFDVKVGEAGWAPVGDGSRLVFRVKKSVVPPFDPASPLTTQVEERYRLALSDDILGGYLSKVGAEIGTKVNQEALRNAAGASF